MNRTGFLVSKGVADLVETSLREVSSIWFPLIIKIDSSSSFICAEDEMLTIRLDGNRVLGDHPLASTLIKMLGGMGSVITKQFEDVADPTPPP